VENFVKYPGAPDSLQAAEITGNIKFLKVSLWRGPNCYSGIRSTFSPDLSFPAYENQA